VSRKFRIALKESLGFKILAAFIAVIIVVLSAFTLFAVVREGNKAKEELQEQGEMLAGLLAHGSMVGVFAENEKLLKDEASGLMGLRNVVAVSIYNSSFKLLYAGGKTLPGQDSFSLNMNSVNDLKTAQSVNIVENGHAFEFLRPVVIKSVSNADESLYFGGSAGTGPEKVIGYVKIVLSKDSYHKEMLTIVTRNAVIMIVFIFSSVVIVYLAVKKVTRPLEKLTESVRALGKGMPVEPAPVETRDEIGNLASAFNAMVVARGEAEEKIRNYHERLLALSSDLSLVEERERRRLATDLHDSIGQMLAVMKIKLGALQTESPPGNILDNLDEIRTLIEQSIQYTRSLTFELSPPALYELGLEAAVEGLVVQIRRQHGIFVNVDKNGSAGKELSDEVKILLFKTIRELLINVVKHAAANTARVSIQGDAAHIRITVEDDGKGFDVVKTGLHSGTPGGFGLFSIRERLKYLGGRFEVNSAPGKGTRVLVMAPRRGPGKNIGG
jgi:signal transduction histidine kinase